ncbi:MAG: hypothetical protein H7Z42_23185, partial [Roseiflexaceae bacterium]|nr:hypothetical protein [Roseiflexaceae bacterium]
MTSNTGAMQRFDRGSWAALIYALAIGLGSLLLVIGVWRIPSDGWSYEGDFYSSTPVITFRNNFSGRPSPLQAGDTLLAVEGVTLEDLADRAHAFATPRPALGPNGTTLRYSVLRGDTPLTLDVPLYRSAPWTKQLAMVRAQGMVAVLQLFSSPFFFAI